MNGSPEEIIRKWYGKVNIPSEHDGEFEALLSERGELLIPYDISTYDIEETDGVKNLFAVLYMCEALSERYKAVGISEDILLDTLSDIPIALKSWYEVKGKLVLGTFNWLSNHMKMELFKLGRLQFGFSHAYYDANDAGLTKGDPVIGVHIQAGTPLFRDEYLSSFNSAVKFFERYFPEYKYTHFTCYSWLLDPTLGELLPEGSNILRFAGEFRISHTERSDRLLNYLFRRGATREDIKSLAPRSSLSLKVKEAILSGKDFYEAFGVIDKSRFVSKQP